jgi:hypothetical protein
MERETQKEINLPHLYRPRDYQLDILAALDSGVKRAVWTAHRRSGKDLTIFNWIIKELNTKIQTCYYILPTYSQAKKIIWEGMTKDGIRFLDFIPKELIAKKSESELSIRFENGSLLQLVGSDNYDRLVGTNPSICVFSEFALQNPTAWEYIRPILAENNGRAIFISTPRGENHFFEVMEIAKESDDWFGQVLSVDDTKAISVEAIAKEKASGMSEELIEQEFYCSFNMGQLGSYYGRCISQMIKENRICNVPYDENLLVYTAWDLGFTDSMSIIFFQKRGNEILIIDHYENRGEALKHYINILREKKYNYGTHYLPHDAKAHNSATGTTFLQVARESGYNFQVLQTSLSILEGIEKARGIFPRIYMDKERCAYLKKCLLDYHAEWDEKAKVFRGRPKHNWSSHTADCFRYMCIALDNLRAPSNSMSKEKLRDMKRKYLGEI